MNTIVQYLPQPGSYIKYIVHTQGASDLDDHRNLPIETLVLWLVKSFKSPSLLPLELKDINFLTGPG